MPLNTPCFTPTTGTLPDGSVPTCPVGTKTEVFWYVDDATGCLEKGVKEDVVQLIGTNCTLTTTYYDAFGVAFTSKPKMEQPSYVVASVCSSGSPIVSAFSIPLPDYIFTATGEGPVWVEVTYSDTGVRTEQFFYLDSLGNIIMTTGNSVGVNPAVVAAPLTQFIGSFGADFFASGADLTVTNADLLAAAVAAGTLVRKSDGTSRVVALTDVITRIDVDLKPVGGHVDVLGVQTVTTASDATHVRGGGVYDIDPGGSSSVGEVRDAKGYLLAANTGDVVIKDGSGVVISFDVASIPA